jgi:RNA polymerase sigma-70 factor (ECF subfamily)
MGQRLVRAKRKIRDARIPYAVPAREHLAERLDTVLGVVYLVFNEGYATTDDARPLRPDLCAEAIRLGRLLVELMPAEPEALGLLALMQLHDARRATRIDGDGALVPLEEQDRSRWSADQIASGLAALDAALALRRRGPYQVQAAIAALHARAARAEETDWRQIAALYRGLLAEHPSAVIELNAAAALAMAEGPLQGLAWIERLEGRAELAGYHLLPAARADLLPASAGTPRPASPTRPPWHWRATAPSGCTCNAVAPSAPAEFRHWWRGHRPRRGPPEHRHNRHR